MCSVEKYSSNVKYAKKSWIIAKLEIQRLKKHTLFLPLLYRVVIDKVLVFLKGYRCVYCIVWKNNLLTSNTLKNGWIITKLKSQRFKKKTPCICHYAIQSVLTEYIFMSV